MLQHRGLANVEQIFSPDYLDDQRPAGLKIIGSDEFKQIGTDARNSSQEVKVTIEDLIAEEDRVAGRLRWDITHLGGKTIQSETIEILHFSGDQVLEHWGAEAWRSE